MAAEDKINRVLDGLKNERFQAQLGNVALATLKNRIFKHGKDVDGNLIGRYRSESHKRKRKRLGRQTAKVDFLISAELRKSLNTRAGDGFFVVRSTGTFKQGKRRIRHLIKIRGYEQRFNRVILAYGDAEREEVNKQIERRIEVLLRDANR